ncbi:MAG: accessory Sec-dependent serine-rich glycoprotein adhesin [Streptococcus salivarius]|nr:accessory Sec-dependent serine-rich glycoprotein adhesin [Streptococcus salivarius]
MFFRRNEGEYRETDRVTRFKLIKSGKQWLRAATSNFGLFKVVKGGADAPSVSAQSVEEKTPLLSGQALLKGIAAAGAVAGGAVATYTAQAEETTTPALESQVTANQDVAVNSESVVLSAAPVSEASAVASTSQESTSSSVDAQASTEASVSVSQSVSQSISAELSQLSQNLHHSARSTQLLIASQKLKAQVVQTQTQLLIRQLQQAQLLQRLQAKRMKKLSWIKTFQKQNCSLISLKTTKQN